MKLKILIFVSVFFTTFLSFRSQSVYNFGASYQYGLNFNNESERQFGHTVPSGLEMNFHKQLDGSKYWEKLFKYPQTGLSLSYIDHGNKYLGSTIALNRYMNYVFVRKKSTEAYMKISCGVLYATQIYEHNGHVNERYNNAIGQHLNFSAELGLGIAVYPTKKLGLNLSATASHFSSGAMSQPNDGLNLIMFKCGASYIIGERKAINFKQPETPEDNRRIKYNININTGFKQVDITNEEKYTLLTAAFYADKKVSRINTFNVGVDIFMNRAVEYIIENSAEHKGKDFKRIGITAGHEFFIGRVGVLTQFGYHVYSPYPAFSDYYQKFGLKYYFSDIFFASVNLRIFKFEISDEISWGIGMRL